MGEWGRRREVNLGAQLREWRQKRGVSLRRMGKLLHCDHSRVWKIESGRLPMTREVAELCDTALDTGGALVAAWVAAQVGLRPAQLPPAPAWLVGREAELVALTAGVRDRPSGSPAVVAIDGPAGVGKTALALRWSHQVAGDYVDGQLYADLRGFAPSECRAQKMVHAVLGEFLSALGVGEVPPSLDQRAALFRSLLADRRMLVVLDNIAGLEDIEPLLPGSAGCAVVVTSRRMLSGLVGRVGATRMLLGPLTEADAVALVTDVIGARRAAAEPAAVTELTRLCGRLPIALHAAAEAIAVYPHRQVGDVVGEWAADDHLMEIGQPTDLATVFSWSYRCLHLDAQRLFRLMGLWQGEHLHVTGVAALAGATLPLTRRLLHSLATDHLITIDCDGLVGLSDPFRAYAHRLVITEDTDDERAGAARRLVTWYLHNVHAARDLVAAEWTSAEHDLPVPDGRHPLGFSDREGAVAWCESEDVNFEAVIRLAQDYGPSPTAQQLLAGIATVRLVTRPGTDTTDSAELDEGESRGLGGQAAKPVVASEVSQPVLRDQGRLDGPDEGINNTCVGVEGGDRPEGPPWIRCGWQDRRRAVPWDDGFVDGPTAPWEWFAFFRDIARQFTDQPVPKACAQQCCGIPRDPSGACDCAVLEPATAGSTSNTS
jgi:Helix-turn-helix domain/NB-ARC domain